MTVVLLDPHRPDTIPAAARAELSGTVLVTEDVPTAVLWGLDHFEPALDDSDPALTLVSTDPDHPQVRSRVAGGEHVIAPARVVGQELLTAVALMDRLRRDGPWEREQTHASLRRYLLEECYELLDTIDSGTRQHLQEELGDLLLQVLFHARIAADDPTDPFDIDDVARGFVQKVRGRTPGVLAGTHSDLQTQIREWEERKAAEKARGSVLDGVATTQPALALTQKVLERLTAAGYPVDTIDPAVLTVTVSAGDDSVEAAARERTLVLIDTVRRAEAAAARSGEVLDSRDAWLRALEPEETGGSETPDDEAPVTDEVAADKSVAASPETSSAVQD